MSKIVGGFNESIRPDHTVGNKFNQVNSQFKGDPIFLIKVIKFILAGFMLMGIGFVCYGAGEMFDTASRVKIATGTATAKFYGYHREYEETTSTTSMPDGTMHTTTVFSAVSYPEFIYIADDGTRHVVREAKGHVFELFETGEPVEILLFPNFAPRLNGFYALYGLDSAVFLVGVGFFLISLLFWKFAVPILSGSHAAVTVQTWAAGFFQRILHERIGPVSLRFLLIGIAVFMGVTVLIALAAEIRPFLPEFRFGSGGRLLTALEEKRFNDAMALIQKGASVNASNTYDQTPLLIALESGRADLARRLIAAGADVNCKSKMLMTPMRIAIQAGNSEMVYLLLKKGASPDTPTDETPPFAYALIAKRYDIARALIEGGADLSRVYHVGYDTYTIGDLARFAQRDELVSLIRSRGGKFLK